MHASSGLGPTLGLPKRVVVVTIFSREVYGEYTSYLDHREEDGGCRTSSCESLNPSEQVIWSPPICNHVLCLDVVQLAAPECTPLQSSRDILERGNQRRLDNEGTDAPLPYNMFLLGVALTPTTTIGDLSVSTSRHLGVSYRSQYDAAWPVICQFFHHAVQTKAQEYEFFVTPFIFGEHCSALYFHSRFLRQVSALYVALLL